MKLPKTLLAFLLLFLVSIACKKDSQPPIERSLGLTNNNTKSWQQKSLTNNGIPTAFVGCDKKKIYTFNVNGKFYFSTADSANCQSPVYLPDTGNWVWNTEKTQITITDSKTHNGQFGIDELSAGYLRLIIPNTLVRLEFTVKY